MTAGALEEWSTARQAVASMRCPFVMRGRTRRSRGQSLAEFALVFPILFLIIAAIIQFGVIFWAQNSINQIARDTGRWAATRTDCTNAAAVIARADLLATNAQLIGHSSAWTATNVAVTWPFDPDPGHSTDRCPPTNNLHVRWVRVAITHSVPVFFPLIPVSGTISTSTDVRMEPTAP